MLMPTSFSCAAARQESYPRLVRFDKTKLLEILDSAIKLAEDDIFLSDEADDWMDRTFFNDRKDGAPTS